jgi:hypothetical protein
MLPLLFETHCVRPLSAVASSAIADAVSASNIAAVAKLFISIPLDSTQLAREMKKHSFHSTERLMS